MFKKSVFGMQCHHFALTCCLLNCYVTFISVRYLLNVIQINTKHTFKIILEKLYYVLCN